MTSMSARRPRVRATRSMRRSVARSRPYPDLISTVVTPPPADSEPSPADASNSPRSAARVAATVPGSRRPSGDLRVRDALQPQFELVRPIPAEHEMGVAVDQPWRDPGSGEIPNLRRLAVRQARHRAEPGDPAALDRQCAVLDRPVRRPPCSSVARWALSQSRSQVTICSRFIAVPPI